jgi:hypothetical protein
MTGHIIYVNCGTFSKPNQGPTQNFALRNKIKQISEMRDYIKLGKGANTERMCYLTSL